MTDTTITHHRRGTGIYERSEFEASKNGVTGYGETIEAALFGLANNLGRRLKMDEARHQRAAADIATLLAQDLVEYPNSPGHATASWTIDRLVSAFGIIDPRTKEPA